MLHKIGFTLLGLVISTSFFGQDYVELLLSDSANFYDIQDRFNAYWADKDTVPGKGFKQFKRWEEFAEARIYPDGSRPDPTIAWEETMRLREEATGGFEPKSASLWYQYMFQDGLEYTSYAGVPGHGRVTVVEASPADSTLLYIGTPSGGLWKSENSGEHWEPLTDDLPIIGVADVAIHPSDPDIIYIATGDNHFNNTYSIGVLKSENGGDSWSTTGLNYTIYSTVNIRKLLIHPTDPDILWAAASNGLFMTTNGGDDWNFLMGGNFHDIDYDPEDLNNVYATTSSGFYKSTDGGETFFSSGLPENPDIVRMELAVAKSNPDIIYVIAADLATSGLYAFYKSTDAGESFFETENDINVLSYSLGGGPGGQAWFDLDITVDPENEDIIYTAGINIWKSVDGGDNFSPTSNAYTPYSSSYVHGDVHSLEFIGSTLYTTCDGGIFNSIDGGENWTNVSSDLNISQIYTFNRSPFNDTILLAGLQDVGSSYYNGDNWVSVTWGDGYDCYFDPNDDQKMYTTAHFGQFFRTSTGIEGFAQYAHGIPESSAFRSVLEQDPSDPETFYAGFQEVWRSINGTVSWTKISNFGNPFPLRRIKVDPNDPNTIYATTNFYVYQTTNGGTTWSNITGSLPVGIVPISDFHIDPVTNDLWLTYSGYDPGKKVYVSTNDGASWSNQSFTLPNLPINCIITENSDVKGTYVGCDVGVYYTNDTMFSWTPYMDGLPNVIVNELDVIERLGIIRAGTFGRGVWESELCSQNFVGLLENSDEYAAFTCYPNPATDVLKISVNALNLKEDLPLSINIIDYHGRVVSQHVWPTISEGYPLNIENLSSGIYYCEIIQNENRYMQNFMVSP